jgi:ArsR family metal-binding transcriptional regulator
MGINDQRDIEANLQIGPTDKGMVRLFIEGNGIEIPMDFTPDEAREIAEEIMAAAARARQSGKSGSSGPSGTPGGKKRR